MANTNILVSACLGFAGITSLAATLEEVASFPNQQVTGIAVSKEGRVFVNFPDWSDDHTISVAEGRNDTIRCAASEVTGVKESYSVLPNSMSAFYISSLSTVFNIRAMSASRPTPKTSPTRLPN